MLSCFIRRRCTHRNFFSCMHNAVGSVLLFNIARSHVLNDSPDKVVRVWCCGCSSGEEVCQCEHEHAHAALDTIHLSHASPPTIYQLCACPEIDAQLPRDVAVQMFWPEAEGAHSRTRLSPARAPPAFPPTPYHRSTRSVSCGRNYWHSTSVRMRLSKFWALMCLLLRLMRAAMPGGFPCMCAHRRCASIHTCMRVVQARLAVSM